ncbi:MAG: RND transporter, partial [Gammaproteobacteria bacterium]
MDARKLNHLGFTAFLLIMMLVSGCTVGPDFEEPVVQSPGSYRTTPDTAESEADLKWWKLFNDP